MKDDTAITCGFTAQPEAGRGQSPHLNNKTMMQPGLGTPEASTAFDLKGERTPAETTGHHRAGERERERTEDAQGHPADRVRI